MEFAKAFDNLNKKYEKPEKNDVLKTLKGKLSYKRSNILITIKLYISECSD